MAKTDRSHFSTEQLAGIACVAVLHTAVLWGLWQHRLLPSTPEMSTLYVNFIAPPSPDRPQAPMRQPVQKPKPIEKTMPRQIVAEMPVVAPADHVAPPSATPLAPAPAIEAPPFPLPVGPVALSSELAVVCAERSAPAYPQLSRRMRETGTVVLRVELAENGHIAQASIQKSSGHQRLDEAALSSVKKWRCSPTLRNGQPARAVALQPFNFELQGR